MKRQVDSAWKDIIEELFYDFLNFFFPDICKDVNFSKGYEFLTQELTKIVKDNNIGKKYIDELVKVFLKDGKETWLLIHIEIQGYKEPNFTQRLYVYNYRLFDKYEKEIVSLVILTDEDKNYKPNKFVQKRWNFKIEIDFPTIKLLDYENRLEELENSNNPFGLVVLVQLISNKVKKDVEKKYNTKLNLIKKLYQKGFAKEKIILVLKFIDWLINLPKDYEQKLELEVQKYEEVVKMPYVMSFERIAEKRGLKEGLKEGLKKGVKRGVVKGVKKGVKKGKIIDKQQTLIRQLFKKFDAISIEEKDLIIKCLDKDKLNNALDEIIFADTKNKVLDCLKDI